MTRAGTKLLGLLIACALLGNFLRMPAPAPAATAAAPAPRRRRLLAVLLVTCAFALAVVGLVTAYERAGRPLPSSAKTPEGGLVLLLAGSVPPTWKTTYDTLLVDVARPASSAPEVTLSVHVEHPTVALVSGAMRPFGPVREIGGRAVQTLAVPEVINTSGFYGSDEPPETRMLGSYDEVGKHLALASVAGLERSTAVAILLDGFMTYTWKLSGPLAVSGQGTEVGALPPIGTPIDGASGALVTRSVEDFGVPRLRRADEAEVHAKYAHRSMKKAPDSTSQREWVQLRGPDYDADAVVPTGLRTIVSVDAPARSRPDNIAPAATLTGDKMVWTAPTRQGQVPAATWSWTNPKQIQDTTTWLFVAALLGGIASGVLLWFLPPRS
jgi:hypothetical protein